jgi:sugar phosphate isomerase/epimerase
MTRTSEAADIVMAVGADALRLHLDTGAMFVNGEDPAEIIAAYTPLIAHVHLSDPGLIPPGDAGYDHASVAVALRRYRPELTATIEMAPQGNASRLTNLRRALTYASQIYG